jgi:hypothetical protein
VQKKTARIPGGFSEFWSASIRFPPPVAGESRKRKTKTCRTNPSFLTDTQVRSKRQTVCNTISGKNTTSDANTEQGWRDHKHESHPTGMQPVRETAGRRQAKSQCGRKDHRNESGDRSRR